MNPKMTRCVDSFIFMALVVILCSVAFGLSFHAGNRVSIVFGDRLQSGFESVSHSLGIAVQLWMFPVYWTCDGAGFMPHDTITKSIVTSLLSAVVLLFLLRLLSRYFPWLARCVLVVLIYCTVVEAHSFAIDFKKLLADDPWYSER